MNWILHNARFVVEAASELPQDCIVGSAWSGHRQFAYDLVRYAKPRKIVELGTYYGSSFFSFCQGIKDGHLIGHCFAIDSWQGDLHMGSYDGDQIFQAVHAVNEREFKGVGTLIRSEFDNALKFFEDGSIDLLHIDGYHTYDAVRHDFLNWYPKLAPNGIVLFHDTAVYYADFGVHRFWEELNILPHFHFTHSHGLGVLFPKGCPDHLSAIIGQQDMLITHYSR